MADVIKYRFRCRRRTAANWTALNEVLLPQEIGLESDTGLGKVGDDAGTAWNSLAYTIVGKVDLTGLVDGKCLAWDSAVGNWKVANRGVAYVAGSHILIDDIDPENPIIGVSGLTVSSSYAEGIAFPGSPALDDKFYRTDLNLLCYYDGVRWLTTNEYMTAGTATDALNGASQVCRWPVRSDYQMYLTRWIIVTYSTSAPTGTIVLAARNAANASTTLSSFSLSGAANNWISQDQILNSVVVSGTKEIQQLVSGTSAFYAPSSLAYRLIIT